MHLCDIIKDVGVKMSAGKHTTHFSFKEKEEHSQHNLGPFAEIRLLSLVMDLFHG